jgi:DNA polymerase-3 subunit epsilon
MRDFVAIDFETANECASSVCSIGAVLVRNGKIVKTFYSLIKPEPDYYKWFCQQVHGLGHEDTDDAEVFPFVWKRMQEELLEEIQLLSVDTIDNHLALPMVAHNAKFDSRCLREVFNCYRMDYPEFVFHDTLAASRKHFGSTLENHQLQTVATACGYNLTNHHHALADAEACAWIAREIL